MPPWLTGLGVGLGALSGLGNVLESIQRQQQLQALAQIQARGDTGEWLPTEAPDQGFLARLFGTGLPRDVVQAGPGQYLRFQPHPPIGVEGARALGLTEPVTTTTPPGQPLTPLAGTAAGSALPSLPTAAMTTESQTIPGAERFRMTPQLMQAFVLKRLEHAERLNEAREKARLQQQELQEYYRQRQAQLGLGPPAQTGPGASVESPVTSGQVTMSAGEPPTGGLGPQYSEIQDRATRQRAFAIGKSYLGGGKISDEALPSVLMAAGLTQPQAMTLSTALRTEREQKQAQTATGAPVATAPPGAGAPPAGGLLPVAAGLPPDVGTKVAALYQRWLGGDAIVSAAELERQLQTAGVTDPSQRAILAQRFSTDSLRQVDAQIAATEREIVALTQEPPTANKGILAKHAEEVKQAELRLNRLNHRRDQIEKVLEKQQEQEGATARNVEEKKAVVSQVPTTATTDPHQRKALQYGFANYAVAPPNVQKEIDEKVLQEHREEQRAEAKEKREDALALKRLEHDQSEIADSVRTRVFYNDGVPVRDVITNAELAQGRKAGDVIVVSKKESEELLAAREIQGYVDQVREGIEKITKPGKLFEGFGTQYGRRRAYQRIKLADIDNDPDYQRLKIAVAELKTRGAKALGGLSGRPAAVLMLPIIERELNIEGDILGFLSLGLAGHLPDIPTTMGGKLDQMDDIIQRTTKQILTGGGRRAPQPPGEQSSTPIPQALRDKVERMTPEQLEERRQQLLKKQRGEE